MRPGRPGSGWRASWRRRGGVRDRGAGQDRAGAAGSRQDRSARRGAARPAVDGRRAASGRGPVDEEEALRDLVRAREDLRGDLMRARHRVGKLLLRHDLRFDGQQLDPGASATGSPASASSSRSRRRCSRTIAARSTRCWSAARARGQMAALVPGSPWARAPRGCGACAASTRYCAPGCAPRSATLTASAARRS